MLNLDELTNVFLDKEEGKWDSLYYWNSYRIEIDSIIEKNDGYNFWFPDEKQLGILSALPEELKEKMVNLGLIYNNTLDWINTIEITLENFWKIIFDKESKIKEEMNYFIAMDRIKKIWWKKPISKDLMEKIIDVFWDYSELIGIDNKYWYWTSEKEENSDIEQAYYGIFSWIKALKKPILAETQNLRYPLYIHDLNIK